MSVLKELLHLLRWDIARARWWMAGCAALASAGVIAAWRDSWNGAGSLIPLVWGVLAGIGTTAMVHADSPIVADRFYRGKPIRHGLLPLSKVLAVIAAFVLPALLVLLVFHLVLGVPAEAVRAASRAVAVGTLTTVGAIGLGALVTTQLSGTIALLVAAYFLTGMVSDWLRTMQVPTVHIGVPLFFAVATSVAWLYCRPVRPRVALLGMLALTALMPLATERTAPRAIPVRVRPDVPLQAGGDSVRVSVDSISVAGRVVRIGMQIDASPAYDGYVLSNLNVTTRSNARLGRLHAVDVVPLNEPTSAVRLATVSVRADGSTDIRNPGLFEMARLAPLPSGSRRISAVAVLVASDSLTPIDSVTLSFTASGYRWRDSVTVPWRVGLLWAHRGERLGLDTSSLGGRRRWRMVQSQPFATASIDSLAPRHASDISGTLSGRFLVAIKATPQARPVPVELWEPTSSREIFAVPGAIRERREGDLQLREPLDERAQLFIARRAFVMRLQLTAATAKVR